METIAIIVGVITGVGTISGIGYKCYRDIYNIPDQQEITIHQPDKVCQAAPTCSSTPVIDRLIEQVIHQHYLEQRDSESSETEIDIKIHIHNSGTHQENMGKIRNCFYPEVELEKEEENLASSSPTVDMSNASTIKSEIIEEDERY